MVAPNVAGLRSLQMSLFRQVCKRPSLILAAHRLDGRESEVGAWKWVGRPVDQASIRYIRLKTSLWRVKSFGELVRSCAFSLVKVSAINHCSFHDSYLRAIQFSFHSITSRPTPCVLSGFLHTTAKPAYGLILFRSPDTHFLRSWQCAIPEKSLDTNRTFKHWSCFCSDIIS